MRFVYGVPTDPIPITWTAERELVLRITLGAMRVLPRRKNEPVADDWTPNFGGDCQNRVAAGMILLLHLGLPDHCLRGYTGAAKLGNEYASHAILGIAFRDEILVLDDQAGDVRTLRWGVERGLYRAMAPRLRVES